MNNKPTAVAPPKTDLNSSFFWDFDFGISIPPSSVSSSGFSSSCLTKFRDRFNLHTEMN